MKKVFVIALVALIFSSCSGTKNAWYPKPIKHGGPCPQNAGMSGYSNY